MIIQQTIHTQNTNTYAPKKCLLTLLKNALPCETDFSSENVKTFQKRETGGSV